MARYKASSAQISEIVELLIKSHIDDPQYQWTKQEKRKKLLKELLGGHVAWASKHTDNLFVKFEQNVTLSNSDSILAVSLWISPGLSMTRAAKSILPGKINFSKTLISETWEFIKSTTNNSSNYWELLDFAPLPEDNDPTDYWGDVILPILQQADKAQQAIYCFTTDERRVKILAKWGFDFVRNGTLSKRVIISAVLRNPR